MTDAEKRALMAIKEAGSASLRDGGMERKLLRKGWLSRSVFSKAVSLTPAGKRALSGQEPKR